MLACQPNLRYSTQYLGWGHGWGLVHATVLLICDQGLKWLTYISWFISGSPLNRTCRTLRKVRKGWSYAKSILYLRVEGHEPWVENWQKHWELFQWIYARQKEQYVYGVATDLAFTPTTFSHCSRLTLRKLQKTSLKRLVEFTHDSLSFYRVIKRIWALQNLFLLLVS